MKEPRVVKADNAGLFALGGTRTFIVGARRVAVVDPGPDDPVHLERVAREVDHAEGGVILLTHRHPDHAAGAPALERRTGLILRFPLADDVVVDTDMGTLRVVATPGHSRDHVAFLFRRRKDGRRILLAGDLLLGEGSTTWVGEYSGCVGDYLASLDRVAKLRPDRILPAHGPPIEDPEAALSRFRRHRLERIRQVKDALEAGDLPGGPRSASDGPEADKVFLEALVDRVYGPRLPPGLREGARWSLIAILEHLGVVEFPAQAAPVENGGGLGLPPVPEG